jgi:hypothetical protein
MKFSFPLPTQDPKTHLQYNYILWILAAWKMQHYIIIDRFHIMCMRLLQVINLINGVHCKK